MTDKIEIEIFIMMDADGSLAVSLDPDDVQEAFENDCGTPTLPVRIVKLKAFMARAAVEDSPTIDIPDTAGTTEQIEVEAA